MKNVFNLFGTLIVLLSSLTWSTPEAALAAPVAGPVAAPVAAPMAAPAPVTTEPSDAALADVPQPLPRECGGVNPPEQLPPACCAYGYVYDHDGMPIADATVTIQGPAGATDVRTELGEHSDDPYFTTSLSGESIGAAVGDTITLSVSHGGFSRTLTYQVAEGGQQVDLVLANDMSDTPIYYVCGADDDRQICRMDDDGGNVTYVRDGWDPDICPVNGRVLYTDGTDIHVMEMDGTYVANLTAGTNGANGYRSYNPDWSPDCSEIAYTISNEIQYIIYRMNADGSGKQQLLTPVGDNDLYPDWAPNGQWIALTSMRRENVNGGIHRMNADGSGIQYLDTTGWYPSWSPDSSRLAFVCFEDKHTVCVMDPDGANKRRIVDTMAWWPTWLSPQRIMYTKSGSWGIHTINADGTDNYQLTPNSYHRSPTVRPTNIPVATIHTIAPEIGMQGRDTITFRGLGQDADEYGDEIIEYRWESSLDGLLGTQSTFTLTASSLSTGTHVITLTVRDDERDWSPPARRYLTITEAPFDMDVLILTNRQRLAALYGESEAARVMAKLGELAQASNGLVLEVERDPDTAAAYAAWEANERSFVLANAVAEHIHDQIVAQLNRSPDLAYVVIAGDDRVVPFRRVRDLTDDPEHRYRLVPDTTTTGAALAADRILTDDYYVDRAPTRLRGNRVLYLPDMAVGRLVETPDEIVGQIDWFLNDGQIEVEDSIVTGYDFLVDSAQEICSAMLADGLLPDCSLIGGNWTVTQFINYVLNQRHELVSYNGHADHYRIYTPASSVSSSQVASGSGDHTGVLIWTPGCHGGLNVPPGTPVALDTVQAWVRRQALLVGNTGFGYGYQLSVGLSEKLMLDYTEQLLAGGENTAGWALMEAKQRYYLEEGDLDEHDEKILIEATLYGVPMARIISPDEAAMALTVSAALSNDRPATVARRGTVTNTEYFTAVSITRDFPALTAETSDDGVYYTCGGQAAQSDGAPIQPRNTEPLVPPASASATVPHGVTLRSALGREMVGVDPVTAVAVLTGEREASRANKRQKRSTSNEEMAAWFPPAPVRLNHAGGQSEIVFSVGQFHGVSGTQRLYDAMEVETYFTLSDDWEPPLVRRIESGIMGEAVTVTVEAEDASGIRGVVVAYSDGDGNWSSVDLIAGDETWSGSLPGDAETELLVQVVDEAGNVTAFTRGGMYLRAGESYQLRQVYLPVVVR